MKGYQVCSGIKGKGYTYHFALTKDTATALMNRENENNMDLIKKGIRLNPKCKVWIERVNLDFCKCGKMMESGEVECLRCDKIRYDMEMEYCSLDKEGQIEFMSKYGKKELKGVVENE